MHARSTATRAAARPDGTPTRAFDRFAQRHLQLQARPALRKREVVGVCVCAVRSEATTRDAPSPSCVCVKRRERERERESLTQCTPAESGRRRTPEAQRARPTQRHSQLQICGSSFRTVCVVKAAGKQQENTAHTEEMLLPQTTTAALRTDGASPPSPIPTRPR
jgi:hypothetical protein